MGIFSTTSPFDSDVEKVTPEEDKNSEDWGSILDICDKVGTSTQNAKDCLKSIIRRLNNPNPHVVLKAITLLDACVNNCSKVFHLEIASREFEQEFRKLLKKMQQQPKVADKLKLLLKKWAENEFKTDPQLSLIPSLFSKLKQEGVDFSDVEDISTKNSTNNLQPKDPNAVTSQQEVDDIAKAIELSLKETNLQSGQNNLYPSTSNIMSNMGSRLCYQNNISKAKHFVKALYDFEAAEDNELTFYSGEIIEVLDDSDKNWWKGVSHRGEGLFPANFVTSDLSTGSNSEGENKKEQSHKNKNRVQFTDNVNTDLESLVSQKNIVINEQKINRLLHLLHEANPTDESADTEEMINLEEEANAMGPLIDAELEKVDRKHAQLTQLSSNLVDALNLYHTLMREPFLSMQSVSDVTYRTSLPIHNLPHPHPIMFNNGNNGNYSLPSGGIIPDQYAQSTLPSVQQPTNIYHLNQQQPHHFIPISTMSLQSNSFHHPNILTNPPPVQSHSYTQNLDPNLASIPYNVAANAIIPPQQVSQNLYQPIQHSIPPQDSTSPGINAVQNNSQI